jgi:REP element-mobilizing transposase RayT
MSNLKARKTNRLKNHDYSKSGLYFITICTKDKEEFFGKIIDQKMVLNEFGEMAQKCWLEIPNHFPNAKLDRFVIMPNHVHGVIEIVDGDIDIDIVGDRHACPLQYQYHQFKSKQPKQKRQYQKIPVIIGSFKSSVTRLIRENFRNHYFAWQRSFHDRIIRNERELHLIRRYVVNNPREWEVDCYKQRED